MTNLERIVREFCEDKNSRERQGIAGDIVCRILGTRTLDCDACPANGRDEGEPCFMKLGKWALEEAE